MWYQPTVPIGPYNMYSYLVSSNPPTTVNPNQIFPKINKTVFLSPFTYIVGDVSIHAYTYIGPFVSIRADEGTPFYIGKNSNLPAALFLLVLISIHRNKQMPYHQYQTRRRNLQGRCKG
jgi:carbonic anhydrase